MDEKSKITKQETTDSDTIEASIEKDEPANEIKAPLEKAGEVEEKQQLPTSQKQDGKLLFFEITTVILLVILTVFITRDVIASRNFFDMFNSQINVGYPHRF